MPKKQYSVSISDSLRAKLDDMRAARRPMPSLAATIMELAEEALAAREAGK